MNKISIIIPAYNIERYIERTLLSVCSQSYRNIEVIVVDDGSTDDTWNIITKFAKNDKRVVTIHQENGGVTSARMTGVKNSTGDWIGFVDGDDIIEEDMFEFLLTNAETYNAQISHCGYKMIFADGMIKYLYNTGLIAEQSNFAGLSDLLSGKYIEPTLCSKLYKIDLFDDLFKSEFFGFSIGNFEDLLMNYYLFKACDKSIYEDKCKYGYIIRSNSANTSKNITKKYNDTKRVFEIIMDDALQTGFVEVSDIAFSRYISFLITNSTSTENEVKSESLLLLRSNTQRVLKSTKLSHRSKIMFILTSYFNPLYCLIRRIYDRVNYKEEKYFD